MRVFSFKQPEQSAGRKPWCTISKAEIKFSRESKLRLTQKLCSFFNYLWCWNRWLKALPSYSNRNLSNIHKKICSFVSFRSKILLYSTKESLYLQFYFNLNKKNNQKPNKVKLGRNKFAQITCFFFALPANILEYSINQERSVIVKQ